MNSGNIIDQINFRAWTQKRPLASDGAIQTLQKPEEAILREIKREVSGRRILDIGIGTGRTIEFLRGISRKYVGIDYSPEMIKSCRKLYPVHDLRCCDARNMSIFKEEEFDFILFSYNGIDYVSHQDRLQILKEVYRVLRKGGLFAFSSHNKGVQNFNRFPFDWPPLTLNPIVLLRNIRKIGIRLLNHLNNKRFEFHTDQYSIINDSGENYSLMTYYITVEEQIRQLTQIGFGGLVRVFNLEGDEDGDQSQSFWIYYLVRK